MKYALLVVALLLVVAQGAMAAAPVAGFTSDKSSGAIPVTVTFTDTTTNTPTGWAWMFGDESWSNLAQYQFAAPAWSGRSGAAAAMLTNGSIVLAGGYTGTFDDDTFYSSNNGSSWTSVNSTSGWTARYGGRMVALPDNSVVLMAGATGGGDKNDVWRSTNGGASWVQRNSSAGWSAREYPACAVLYDGTIILTGGGTTGSWKNDVWSSSDSGSTWTRLNASAGWVARYGHHLVVLPNDTLVLFGGYDEATYKKDVWRSTDRGVTWYQMTSSASWTERYEGVAAAMPDGSIILSQGMNAGYLRDTWRSSDCGATWTQINVTAGFTQRKDAAIVLLRNSSMLLCGGYGGGQIQEVWLIQSPAGSQLKNPSHVYSVAGNYSVALKTSNADGINTTLPNYKFINATAGAFGGGTIVANFTASATSGVMPKSVTFTDTSTSGVTGWTYFFGDEDYSSLTWTAMNLSCPWTIRAGHGQITLPDSSTIIFMGNNYGVSPLNDCWRTTDDGVTWTQQTASVSSMRYSMSYSMLSDGTVVFGGGYSGAGNLNDVWASTDKGATWTQKTASAGWTARNSHAQVTTLDDTIVLSGGWNGATELTDVWRSTDGGATWSSANSSAWTKREGHVMVRLQNGNILAMGGYSGASVINDIWMSSDKGSTWTVVNASPAWSARYNFFCDVMPDGSLVLGGGSDAAGNYKKDVWRSTDNGVHWTQINDFSYVIYDQSWSITKSGGMLLTGGHQLGGSDTDDAFILYAYGSRLQSPSHTYTAAGNYTPMLMAYNSTASNITPLYSHWVNISASASGNTADFYAVPTVGTSGSLIHFYNASTIVDGGTGLAFNWSFGDGVYSTTVGDVTHIYNASGVYNVGLNVTTSGGSAYMNKSNYIQITAPSTNYYAPRTVSITTLDWKNNPVADVNITACPSAGFTMPESWISLYYGVNVNQTTQCLIGHTGDDGSWAAPMSESIRYNFTFSSDVFATYYERFYPVQDSYIIHVPVGVYVTPTPAPNYISYALANTTINATHENITLSYKDSSGGSSLVAFTVKDQLGNIKYYGTSSAFGTCWTNMSAVVSHTSGDTLIYNFSATQSQLGYVNVSKTLSWFSTAMAGLCDSNGNCFPPWVGQWLSIAILVGLTATFSILSKKFALIIVPVVAIFLMEYLHWLQPVAPVTNTSAIAVFGVLLALGILLYIRDSGKRGGG